MNTVRKSLIALACLAGAWPLFAQTVTPTTAKTDPVTGLPVRLEDQDKDVIVLSPFEVTTSKDAGYQATETLAGTRIRTDLKDVGAALSVYTKEFMKDIGATDNATLLQYTTNAEVAGTRGTYAGLGNGSDVNESGNLRAPGGAQRVRGLAAADNTRDFFVTDIPWDSFNVDRIDIQRGPNSILFGLGSPAGIVNATTRSAEFRNAGSLESRFGSYGTVRNSLDFNQVLVPGVLAIRVDGLWNDEKFQQKPAFQDDKRYYGALRFEPQLFSRRDFHTILKVNYEHGDIDANRPRITPPVDQISPWFRPANNTTIEGGMGKFAIDYGYQVPATPSTLNPWLGGVGDQQQPLWFIDAATNQLIRIYSGYINTGARNNDGTVRTSGQNLLGSRFSGPFYGVTSLNSFATNAGLPNAQYGQYRQSSLKDPTVFDFYNNLIDGSTKMEFEKWNAYSVDLSQTGWNDRVAVQLNFDRQKYTRGGQALVGNPTLNIDILRAFQDLAANPNFGRPFIQGGPGSGNSYLSDRKYARGSLFGEVRATDFWDANSLLAKIVGKHRFNGVYANESYRTETRSWQMYANSREWAAYWNRTDGSSSGIGDRPPLAVMYLGSSLANATTAAGANIPGITAPVALQNGNIYYFDSTWNNLALPPTAANVSSPWVVPANLAPIFDATATTQASNPANYVGWNTNFQANLLRYNNGQDLSLLTGAQKTLRKTTSYAGSWQGFWWNDAIVTTVGWRFDQVKNRGVTGVLVNTNRNAVNLNPVGPAGPVGTAPLPYVLPDGVPDPKSTNQSYSLFKDHSTAGGVVLHLNKLFQKDPLPFNLSLSYNKSNNFQITDTRRDIYGAVLENPTGATKDYGVLLSTKDGKYSLRAVRYETTVANASIQSNIVTLVGNPIQQGLRFRNVFLYKLGNYPYDSREQPQDRNNWQPAYVDSTGKVVAAGNVATPPAGATLQTQAQADAMRDASIRAWNTIQTTLAAKGYFGYWGYTPTNASALTDRATYEANGLSPVPDPATVFAYLYPAPAGPQGLTMTGDTTSKGYEFEFTANPTRNWRISFNASQTTAVRSNVGGSALADFVSYMDTQMAGPAGDMRQFSGGYSVGNLVRTNWAAQRAQYTLLSLQQGAAAPEIRKWRYNVVTNYSFREGMLKGAGIGASYRWQDKVVIGYPVIPDPTNSALGSFDLTKPYYGPSEASLDLWVSYQRRITKKIDWKIQLNVRNAGQDNGLIPTSVQPDGTTWAAVRVKPTQEWFVTNTFSF